MCWAGIVGGWRSIVLGTAAYCLALSMVAIAAVSAAYAQSTEIPTADAAALDQSGAVAEAQNWFESNVRGITRVLADYNKRTQFLVHSERQWNIKITSWKIHRVEAGRVFAAVNIEIGRWNQTTAGALFELLREGDRYSILGHGPIPKSESGQGMLATSQNLGCVYNYFSPRPCIGTLRIWREFTELHGLEMDGQSAKILQAYKHHDFETGNRLMARAQGLPDPGGASVFGLQADVTALNLGQYQRNPKTPCDLNPYGVRPCPEVQQIFEDFAARRGLPATQQTANMFEAYGNNDFRRADVSYALAKGLPVPAYGFIPTGVAREVAALNLSQYQTNLKSPCDLNPYGVKPCLQTIEIWRDFAERYQLADNQRNAAIFQAYANGEFKQGDQLLAQAKGVSLEQLLEASGVPTEGLVIEVFPGRKQFLLRHLTGT